MLKPLEQYIAVFSAVLLSAVVFGRGPAYAEGPIPVWIVAGPTHLAVSVPTHLATVGSLLAAYGVETDGTIVSPPPETQLVPNLMIAVTPIRTFVLHDGSDPSKTLTTAAEHVGDALVTAGIRVDALDIVEPSFASALGDGGEVRITRIRDELAAEQVSVPYGTVVANDPERLFGSEIVISQGTKGVAEEVIRLRYVNNQITNRMVLSRTMIQEPVAQHVQRGTKIVVDRVQEGGASWYRYRNCNCAAHNQYPRGTWLRVTNLLDGAQQIVRTNDWGPDPAIHPERVIDLDATVFSRFAPLGKGVIPVRVEKLKTEQ